MSYTINSDLSFENEMLELNGRQLIFKSLNQEILLSKQQSSLIFCLLNEINGKEEIIRYVWGDEDNKKRENNFNQLIFQLRVRFASYDLPSDLLIALPRYGLCLNKKWLEISSFHRQRMAYIVNDHAAYL